jgi:multidrug efflux pump subunit AcrA (membrane-fusion protein)
MAASRKDFLTRPLLHQLGTVLRDYLLYSAQKDLDRFKTLALKAIESQQNVDRQQGSVAQLKAAIAADEAMIETAQTQLDYTNITAPSDGRIGMRLIDPGNIVHAADSASIATLTLTRPCAVLFTLRARGHGARPSGSGCLRRRQRAGAERRQSATC